MIIAQTFAEYSLLNSIAAGLATLRYRIEEYIGPGNLKYVLIGLIVLAVLMFARWLRRHLWF